MTWQLQMIDYGPHANTSLTLAPLSEMVAPSAAGKSHVASAVCLLLWGVDARGSKWSPTRLRDGASRSQISLRRAGIRVSRTFAKSPGAMKVASGSQSWSHRSQLAAAETHAVAAGRDVGLVIVSPDRWQTLASTKGGRPLRDVLLEVLPPVDMRALVAQHLSGVGGLRDRDPLQLGKPSSGHALQRQRECNAAADRADGAVEALQMALEALEARPPVEPDAQAVTAAEQTLQVLSEWHAYRDARGAWQRAADGYLAALRDAQRHDEQVARLGSEPAAPEWQPPHPGQLIAKRQQLEAAAAQARLDASQAQAALDAGAAPDEALLQARAALRQLDEAIAEHRDACPTCGAPMDTSARDALQAKRDAARAHADQLEAAHAKRVEQWQVETRKTRDDSLATANRVRLELDSVEQRLRVMRGAQQRHSDAVAAVERWHATVEALGSRPAVPPEPDAEEPAKPSTACPTQQAVDAARATLAAAQAYSERRQAWQREVEEHELRVRRAKAKAATARAEADRVAALVAALRVAPTEAAALQAKTLAAAIQRDPACGVDLQVRFASLEEKGDDVQVLVNGRDWRQASTGQLCVAGALLRDAVRRLAVERQAVTDSLRWADLPVVVDNAQDWSGDWPAVSWSGPMVWLLTEDTDDGSIQIGSIEGM